MPTLDDVRQIALALPQTSERLAWGTPAWQVNKKSFAWDRPLRRGDIAALADEVPEGPILGVRVEHEGIKAALIAEDPDVYFTIPHFNGYPAVLVRLERITRQALEELIAEAWLCRAPKKLAGEYVKSLARPTPERTSGARRSPDASDRRGSAPCE